MKKSTYTRRDFLKLAALSSSSLALQPKFNLPSLTSIRPTLIEETPDVEFNLTATQTTVNLFENNPTTVWQYQGQLISGPTDTLTPLPNSYLGPIIRVEKNAIVRIHFTNNLTEPSIIHWHGLHVPEAADGHPRLVIDPGQTYTYTFQILDQPGTYWYHPHPHGRTGPQVYQGLAGLFIITDPQERALNLPQGEFDIPIVLQDRRFDQDAQFLYGNTMMDQMIGFLGNTLLVNGSLERTLSLKPQTYRLRFLNGSNSRIYKLAWQDKTPLTIIGTDGGLLETPIQKDYLTLAPAQRIDLYLNLSDQELDAQKQLINLPFDTYGGESSYTVLTLNIDQPADNTPLSILPTQLTTHQTLDPASASNQTSPFQIDLQMFQMNWRINGRTFQMEAVTKDETIPLGDTQIWQFNNIASSGMGMMSAMNLAHPMHVHGLQFKILERTTDPAYQPLAETLQDGFVDQGWHDTVLVLPGQSVKILLSFQDFTGLYLYHCHNLEHEDMGMMRNYLVE